MNSEKLALGTAQFGMAYGTANQYGQVPPEEVRAILEIAFSSGMRTLDTAISYGDTETCLGQVGVDHWQIVTSLPPLAQEDFWGLNIIKWAKTIALPLVVVLNLVSFTGMKIFVIYLSIYLSCSDR